MLAPARSPGDALLKEFRAALVATTAAAYSVEAMYGDFKYLIEPQRDKDARYQTLMRAFRAAFGLSGDAEERLRRDLRWLFERRDEAVHPYTESETPAQHPAGFNTGVEHQSFNAVESGRAVDTALTVLDIAATPSTTSPRWIRRWASLRSGHHDTVRPLRDERNRQPLP